MVHPSRNVTCICHLWSSKSECITLICAPDSPASATKNIVPQCLAHQQIQTTHFHATPTKSFRGSSPCDRGSTSIKIAKKSTPRKLVLNLLSRKQTCRSRKLRGRARGRVAIRPIKIWRNKNQNSNGFVVSGRNIYSHWLILCRGRKQRLGIINSPRWENVVKKPSRISFLRRILQNFRETQRSVFFPYETKKCQRLLHSGKVAYS